MRMRNDINKIKCWASAKNAAPGWTGLMSFSQTSLLQKKTTQGLLNLI